MTSSEVLDMLRADFPVRRSYHGYLTSNLKFSAYFRDKYASNDSILLSMLRELPHTETIVEKTPVLRIDLNFTQIASGRDLEDIKSRPEGLKDVGTFQIDIRDDKVTSIYFTFDSEILDQLDDTGRVARLSEVLNLPARLWTTGTTHHAIVCGNEFTLTSHRAEFISASRFSLMLRDSKETARTSADVEQFLKKEYEERKKKLDTAGVQAASNPANY